MIIFISAISSNTESFDRLENCDENIIAYYLQIIQKYTCKFDYEDNSNLYGRISTSRISRITRFSKVRKSNNDSYKRINEEEIEEKNNIIEKLQYEISDLEMKNKEYLSELENLNALKESNDLLRNDLIKEKERNDRMQGEFEKIVEDKIKIIKNLEEKLKSINYKYDQLNDKKISLENELLSYKDLKMENVKLKNRVKDLHLIKEKDEKINELENEIENKNNNIKRLNNDIGSLNKKISQLTIDKFTLEEEKRKNINIQNQLNLELEEQKKQYKILDDKMKIIDTSINSRLSLNRVSRLSINNNNNLDSTQINLQTVQYENEIETLNIENEELKAEIQKLKNNITEVNSEKNKLLGEKNLAILEKEKCLESFQQTQLEIKNTQIEYEKNIKEYEKKINDIKNNYLIKEKEKDKEIILLKEELEKQKENESKIKESINKEEIDKLTIQCMNLKNENEELFERMQKEHKLIASAMSNISCEIIEYKLNKNKTYKQKLEEIPKNWYEIERQKNFPSLYYDDYI